MSIKILKSKLDKSMNLIIPHGTRGGFLETRYVKRHPDKISLYVSSFSGCNLKCKMCYLTQNKDFSMKPSTLDNYIDQVNLVMDHYKDIKKEDPALRLNVNFMARGDALLNPTVLKNYQSLYDRINVLAQENNLILKMNISTIMPKQMELLNLAKIIGYGNTELYYSLYSLLPEFRKKWLPGALDYKISLEKIKELQLATQKPITLHWACIKGENDCLDDIKKMSKYIRSFEFNGKFNLVRYNPHALLQKEENSMESDKLNDIVGIMKESFLHDTGTKIIQKVGPDVYASCGMFVK